LKLLIGNLKLGINMDTLSLIPLGGPGNVTRNMYIYEYNNQILIVDCGLGFPDETMFGVDLLVPDITYILNAIQSGKKIVGMCISHGHEDHLGALPFILPQLPNFPIFATPLTASFCNEKLKEFGLDHRVQSIPFTSNQKILGDFSVSFIHVTHSVPDTSHMFIKTPIGNFYHGSDFKFDDMPWDKKVSDYQKITQAGNEGVLCLLSDCLGTEKKGNSGSETPLYDSLYKAIQESKGKCLVTTYSSHIARLNQIIQASETLGKKVCFIGRSLIKAKEIAIKMGYIKLDGNTEIQIDELERCSDSSIVLLVAGSQGQENSSMARIVNGEHKEIKLTSQDTIIFSSDTIPGNEVLVNSMIDEISKKGIRVLYPKIHVGLHVSGHGSWDELVKLIQLTKPKTLLPIGGNFRHMALYKQLAKENGYTEGTIFLVEDGQEVVFNQNGGRLGRKIPVRNVFVDEITGEELESFVLRDRQKLSESGIVIIMVEIDSSNGQLVGKPDIITRGFAVNIERLTAGVERELCKSLKKKNGLVSNWTYMRKFVGEVCERFILRKLRKRPLVLPVVIEV